MSIEVNIKKTIGNFHLESEFEAGQEIFALLGASGCGKSMTLKCIAGIETPDEGRIVINGRVVFDSAKRINLPPRKRKVGYMFQDYALFPNMTVEENIMSGMGKKPPMDKVREYVERFQLTGLEKRLPSQISGGQKQRVALARMMASQPGDSFAGRAFVRTGQLSEVADGGGIAGNAFPGPQDSAVCFSQQRRGVSSVPQSVSGEQRTDRDYSGEKGIFPEPQNCSGGQNLRMQKYICCTKDGTS